MNLPFIKSLMLMTVLLSACSSQAPTETDYLGKEFAYDAPGVWSGDKGGFSLGEIFSGKKRSGDNVGGATAYDVSLPAMDQKSFEEYERFKAWRRSNQPGSAEFKEYQDWQAYQEYRRFKAQKESTVKQ